MPPLLLQLPLLGRGCCSCCHYPCWLLLAYGPHCWGTRFGDLHLLHRRCLLSRLQLVNGLHLLLLVLQERRLLCLQRLQLRLLLECLQLLLHGHHLLLHRGLLLLQIAMRDPHTRWRYLGRGAS